MKKSKNILLGLGIVLCCCCQQRGDEWVTGAYARQWSLEPENINGMKLGKSEVRDTIFIKKKQDGFEVRNHRWRLNDDGKGWFRRSEGTLKTYPAVFDPTDSTLVSKFPGVYAPIYLDDGNLYRNVEKSPAWKKVK